MSRPDEILFSMAKANSDAEKRNSEEFGSMDDQWSSMVMVPHL